MDDEDAETPVTVPVEELAVEPAFLPEKPARPDGRGPLVPATPGLRVPEGYFARARLHVGDVLMPYALVSFARSEGEATLRLWAVGGPYVIGGPNDGTSPLPHMHAVIPIALPEGSKIDQLEGLTLGIESLQKATVTLRLSRRDRYLIEVDRLSIETLGETAITGSFEGRARRGSRAKTWLPVEVGFVALLGPSVGVR